MDCYKVVTDKLEKFGIKRGSVMYPTMNDIVESKYGRISISECRRLKPEWFYNIGSETKQLINSL